MKHIFFTHSHITSLVVKCAIEDLNLAKNDVLIICEKSHFNLLDKSWFKGINIQIYSRGTWSRFWFRGSVGSILREWAMSLFMFKLAKFKKFLLYLPHDFRSFSKHLIFHRNCIGYHYIEEGLGSYIPKLFHPFKEPKNSVWAAAMPKAWQFEDSNIYNLYPKLLGGICFDSKAFPPLGHKIVLKNIVSTTMGSDGDLDAPYLIFDDMVNMKLCTQEHLISVLASYFVEKNIKSINIKFHYRQTESEKKIIFEELKRLQVQYHIINNERVMELFFIGRRVNVIGFISSLLHYHKLFGKGETTSLFTALANKEKDKDYSNYDYLLGLFNEKGICFFQGK